MFLRLYSTYPQTVLELLELIPQYGSYKDWFRLIELTTGEDKELYSPLVDRILSLASDRLRADVNAMSCGNRKEVSLIAKWAPREKRAFNKQVGLLAAKLFPESKSPKKDYRKLVASLNEYIHTTEILMSGNRWDELDFGRVPSIALMKNRKAFLNEKLNVLPTSAEDETGNRYPDDAKRVACRKRLRQTMLEEGVRKLKGRQLFPQDIVNSLFDKRRGKTSSLEKDLLQHQWNDIRESVKEAMLSIDTEMGDGNKKVIDLGKLLSMTDVSGSMTGNPMWAAIGLSILDSELAGPAFANRFLTFSADPTWVILDSDMSIAEKVERAARAPWGMNTNFVKATELILDTAVEAKLSPDEIPDLIVFSDMQFDEAQSDSWSRTKVQSWETHHERLARRFHETGVEVCGSPWPLPHIIYWNLRGDTGGGCPVQSDTEGVTLLSGFSPALLKLLLSGGDLEGDVEVITTTGEDGEVIVTKQKKDPYATLRAALDDSAYDKVREVLGRSLEGRLREYEPAGGQDEWVVMKKESN
jgi:hypothetical protein